MLVDIPNEWCDEYAIRWNEVYLKDPSLEIRKYRYPSEFRVGKGMYLGYFSEYEMGDHVVSAYPWDPLFMFSEKDYDDFDDCVRDRFAEIRRQWDLDYPFEVPPSYGIADSLEQVLIRWPQIEQNSKLLVLYGIPIIKDDQQGQGFRFHKNGTYIGTQKCMGYEYFGDEPYMTDVISWHLVEVKD